jgi:hypothetical protein
MTMDLQLVRVPIVRLYGQKTIEFVNRLAGKRISIEIKIEGKGIRWLILRPGEGTNKDCKTSKKGFHDQVGLGEYCKNEISDRFLLEIVVGKSERPEVR